MPVTNDDTDLIPTYAVGDYFGRGSRTVQRWQRDPELNFPQPIVIRKRKYWRRSRSTPKRAAVTEREVGAAVIGVAILTAEGNVIGPGIFNAATNRRAAEYLRRRALTARKRKPAGDRRLEIIGNLHVGECDTACRI